MSTTARHQSGVLLHRTVYYRHWKRMGAAFWKCHTTGFVLLIWWHCIRRSSICSKHHLAGQVVFIATPSLMKVEVMIWIYSWPCQTPWAMTIPVNVKIAEIGNPAIWLWHFQSITGFQKVFLIYSVHKSHYIFCILSFKESGKRFVSVLWQKPLHQ